MQLDLNDPDSIIAWWKVFPDRHDGYLDYKAKASPEFAPTIREARRRIASSQELTGLLAQAAQRTQQFEAEQAERRGRLSALELRHHELATA